MSATLLVLLAMLFTYRISHMIAIEEGPFSAFTRLRYLVGQRGWIGRGLACVLCTSIWIAIVPAILLGYDWAHDWFDFGLLWLGIAGGALLMHKLIYK